MQIHIYAENTTQAGRICRNESLHGSGDIQTYEGTKEELAELAIDISDAATKAFAGRDLFLRRVSNSIIDELEY